ncbi:hypothetical protein SAMN05216357_112115 [Porphyromonadaceae bacterium KH3CP3RA]|nr:hypothetical protein SAMN05216357_112115 [Porphyromonadaceae bacterium KH3CP3RA]
MKLALNLNLTALLIVLLSACGHQGSEPKNNIAVDSDSVVLEQSLVVAFVNEFLREHPAYFNNNLTVERLDAKFADCVLMDTAIYGIPWRAELIRVGEGAKNKGYYAIFNIDDVGINNDKTFRINGHVIGFIPESKAETIVKGNKYSIFFRPVKYVDCGDMINIFLLDYRPGNDKAFIRISSGEEDYNVNVGFMFSEKIEIL